MLSILSVLALPSTPRLHCVYLSIATPVLPPLSTGVPEVEVTATPQSRIALGQDVSLFCNATPNAGFTYVWSFNSGPALTETTDTLNLTSIVANQFGNYTCAVKYNTAEAGSGEIVIEEGGTL